MSFDQGPNKGQGPLDGDTSEWDRQASINLQVSVHPYVRSALPAL